MQLDSVMVFVKVIQGGSFTAAAKLLGMPVTTVSGKIAALEKSLGVTLIQRTTRKLHITEAGEVVFKRGLKALAEIEAAEDELAHSKAVPEGLLRVSCTADLAQSYLLNTFQSYLEAYPRVQLELLLTGRLVDLVAENVDLAIRVGELKDSTLISRKYMDSKSCLWASPDYLKKHGKPKTLRSLEKHTIIRYKDRHPKIKLNDGKRSQELSLSSRFFADDMTTLKLMVMAGGGIGLLPDFICHKEIQSGELVRIFPHWSSVTYRFSFVYPGQRFVSPKVQSFMNWILKNEK